MVKLTLPGESPVRRPRPTASLPGNQRRSRTWPSATRSRRRTVAVLITAVGVMAGGLGAAGMPVLPADEVLLPGAAAVQAPPNWYPSTGRGLVLHWAPPGDVNGVDEHWLGANAGPNGTLVWCIEWDTFAPTPDQLYSPEALVVQDQRGDVSSELRLNPAQAYILFSRYQSVDEDTSRAALSILAHANYDQGSYVAAGLSAARAQHPSAYAKAVAYADWARKNTPHNVEVPAPQTSLAQRHSTINGIRVTDDAGRAVAGIPVTVTLSGPAIFDVTGTASWSGTTGTEAISLGVTSTGNGEVSAHSRFTLPGGRMIKYANDGSIQDELGLDPHSSQPRFTEKPGEPFRVFYDFQPVGTSKVVWERVDKARVLNDTFVTAADESYTESPEWMYDGRGSRVPVVYHATAYWSDAKPTVSNSIPAGAVKIGETTVTAHGPGQTLKASVPAGKQGWVAWVWEVRKAEQGDYASYVARDWSDNYGLADETHPERQMFKPVGRSNVAGDKVTAPGQAPCDTFQPATDPAVGDGSWTRIITGSETFSKAPYVPVTYTATAYRVDPEVIPAGSPTIPAHVTELGSVDVTATKGPEEKITACLPSDPGPGFLTWVWDVKGEKQTGRDNEFITPGWSDAFGVPDETTSAQYTMEVDSEIHIHHTKSGDYLSDDLFVTALPTNHTTFEGDTKYGFKADVDQMSQSLLFFPRGLEVSEANKAKAETIATVQVDVRNGFCPHVGATRFKMKQDKHGRNVPGTYVFVTSFPGDDRVAPFTSSVTDTFEQIEATVPPEIKTTATDKADGDKLLAPTGNVTITDKVCQVKDRGLEPGKTYTLTATAMDPQTGAAFKDENGNPYTGTAQWTPASEADCGLVDVTIPARAVWGKSVVMFEDVTRQGKSVAVHADITDEGQTVKGANPGITTALVDEAEGDQEVEAGDITLTDTITPTSADTWEPGRTYRITGTLMDKETGEAITDTEGNPITAETEFTAKSAGDKPTITFNLNTQALTGHDLVAFDKTSVKNADGQWEDYVTHEDLDAVSQTVHVRYGPELGTTLTDKTDGDHEVTAGPVTLTDHVCPKNEDTFKPGTQYTLVGTLMDKATGKPILDKDANPVTTTTHFTPTKASECGVVVFKFDTTDLAGHDLVAFEEAYTTNGHLYADHKNTSDSGQTIHVKPAPPLAKTGAAVGSVLIGAAGLIGSGAFLVTRRKTGNVSQRHAAGRK